MMNNVGSESAYAMDLSSIAVFFSLAIKDDKMMELMVMVL